MKSEQKKWYFILVMFLAVLMLGIAADVKAAKKIRIGVIGPMKFIVGEHQWMGGQLAAEQINNAGGISVGAEKRMIELVKVDDNNLLSVSDAVSAIERAITVDKVDFLTGGGRSESMLAQQEIMAKYKTIYMNTSSGAMQMNMRIAKDYDKYKYWFRVGMFNGKYTGAVIFANVEMIAKKIRKDLGIATPNVAILAEKVMWPDGIIKAAKGKLPKMGMKLVGVWRPSPTATDTTAELTAKAVLPRTDIVITQSLDQALIKLLNGEIDGLISDFPYCKVAEYRYKDQGLLVYDKILSFEQLGIGVAPGDPLFINLLTNYLNLLVGSGALKAMQEYWFKSSEWIVDLPDLTIFKDF